MKCEVCDKQIRKTHTHDGNYSHFYYLDGRIYFHEYQDYDKSPSLTGKKSKDDVMVCSKCLIEKEEEITIPGLFPEEQFKKYLIKYIKNRRKI